MDAYLGLWESEVSPDEDEPRAAAPDKAGVATEIPRCRVNHVVLECTANDAGDVGNVACKTHGLLSQSGRADLGRQSPSKLAGAELEGEGPDQGQNSLRPSDSLDVGPDVENTDQAQLDCHGGHTNNVNGAATEAWHENEPIAEASEQGQAVGAPTHGVGSVGVKTDLLEEVGGGVGEAETAHKLATEDNAGDFGATTVEAFEAIPVGSADAKLFLEVVGVYDRGQSPLRVERGTLLLKAANGFLSTLKVTLAHQVPGAFGSEVDGRNEETRPDPLNCEWNSVTPLICSVDKTTQDTGADKLANDKAHVGVAGEIHAKLEGNDLGSVGGSRRREL